MSDTDFIGIYPGVLDEAFCRHLVGKFEAGGEARPGRMVHGQDRTRKDSVDIRVSAHPDWRAENDQIVRHTIRALVPYVRAHPFLLVGAVGIDTTDAKTGQRRSLGHRDVERMSDPQIAELVLGIYRLGSINLQKYRQGEGHYRHWHSEVCPSPEDPRCEAMHRVLLWMYYLNDVDEGGETEFYFQSRKIAPRRGTFVVAPSGFTHTHRGQVPLSGDKYILTSWVLFHRAETIYRQ